ncbi:unnamed protein product [Symbiodinium sp. CCMP2456]|nr:unnamed protein product [Symbiodinium sp. CCMP2456]
MKLDSAGTRLWTYQGGTSGSDIAYAVVMTALGDVVTAGQTYGGLDGSRLWTYQAGTSNFERALGVDTDASGDIVVVGFTAGGLNGNSNSGNDDMFVLKLDSSLSQQWTYQTGTSGEDQALAVRIDSSGDIVVVGSSVTATATLTISTSLSATLTTVSTTRSTVSATATLTTTSAPATTDGGATAAAVEELVADTSASSMDIGFVVLIGIVSLMVGVGAGAWGVMRNARARAAVAPERGLKPCVVEVAVGKLPISQPQHWSDELIPLDQGWKLYPVDDATLKAIKAMFTVKSSKELGRGGGATSYDRAYSTLAVHCAWRIQHDCCWTKYAAERNKVLWHMNQIRRGGIALKPWTSRLEDANLAMPGTLYTEEVGERYLLHGTNPEPLLEVLHRGFTEKASLKGPFGAGIYLAEDPEKIDQHTRPDARTSGLEDLHPRLYRAFGNRRPDEDMFYCFIVRACCGACFQTEGLDKEGLRDKTTGRSVFLTPERRELSRVPGTSPSFSYHTLLVNPGTGTSHSAPLPATPHSPRHSPLRAVARVVGRVARFREIVVFAGDRVYPEYLVAYRRV